MLTHIVIVYSLCRITALLIGSFGCILSPDKLFYVLKVIYDSSYGYEWEQMAKQKLRKWPQKNREKLNQLRAESLQIDNCSTVIIDAISYLCYWKI